MGLTHELPEKLIPMHMYVYKQEQAHKKVLIAQLVTGSQPP